MCWGQAPGQQNKHIREGEQNHAHIQKVPQQPFGMSFGLPFYAWTSHGRSTGRWCPPTNQGVKKKSQVPTVIQQAGLHEAPMPLFHDANTHLLAGAWFGQAQSQKDRGKQEDVWARNIPACPTVCSESSVMTCTRFSSDNTAGEMLLTLKVSAQVSWHVNPTT